ncbi:phosphotransferase family protein [Tomitella gaofuii]|uniref:phosphotransferase family protein n=1 Tax=Tomitella gaofuii TaxID=2760083 RepID=UPI0015FB45C4|nr:phosphotransferase family protein [Tomitella gaofuii]
MAASAVGIAHGPVADWFTEHVRPVESPLRFTRIAGGRSNLTFAVVDDASRRWVLRRPPLGWKSGNAHDVVREADVLRRMSAAGMPVPAVLGVCEDPDVNGAPFFVMEHVDGAVLRRPDDFGAFPDPAQRARIGHSLIEVLTRLHRADLAAAGWGARAGQRGFIERQLGLWSRNWESGRIRLLGDIEQTRDLLAQRIPPQRTAAIVHGDFRLDNCLIGPDCAVTGVLDWELTTVGDPLADLGHFLVYWAEPGDAVKALEDPPTAVPDMPTRSELARAYIAQMRGVLDVSERDVDFHVAFSWWKTACIVENVYARMAQGAMGDSDRTPESFGAQAERLAARAHACARALR